MNPRATLARRRVGAGFTLIELMVAMLLGLVVIAGVASVFLANQRANRTNHALGDVQDNARTAFELMARDIRNAGLLGCSNNGRIGNVLKNSATAWWANWNNMLVGYTDGQTDPAVATGSGAGNRIAGTDSLMLIGAEGTGATINVNAEPAGTFTLNEASTDLAAGDILLVCDPDHSVLVQATAIAGNVITHATDSGTPGNCTSDLNFPTVCSSTASYVFAPNSQVAKLWAADWYVGNNPDGGRSLYRIDLVNNGGVPAPVAQEMVRNVTRMSVGYHVSGAAAFVAADAVAATDWPRVDSVQVHWWLESTDQRAGTDAKPLQRDFVATTTVRNRVL